MNLDQAKKLRKGDQIHHIEYKNSDGTPQRYRITSIKTWKTRPDQIRLGIGRGLYEHYYITEEELKFYDIGYGS